MIAENLIRNDITPLQQKTAVADALAQLEDFKVSHLPVASGTDFLGLVAEEALLEWPEDLLNFEHQSCYFEKRGDLFHKQHYSFQGYKI